MEEKFDKILQNCKRKNRQAQLAMFQMFCKEVYNSSFRILNNSSQAEEVTQDTFLKLFDRINKIEGSIASVRSFLKRVAVNHSIDIYRQRKTLSFISIDDNTNEPLNCESEPSDDYDISVSTVKEVLNNMPEGYRLVLTLRLIEEMSFDDIALQLGITASTVRSQYVRGRDKLKDNLINRR